jgi:hypothetical protein
MFEVIIIYYFTFCLFVFFENKNDEKLLLVYNFNYKKININNKINVLYKIYINNLII